LALVGLLAISALILTAFGIILGIVKLADAVSRIGAILGVVMIVMLAPALLGRIWSAIPLWQRLSLTAISIGVWLWLRPQPRKRRTDIPE
jgi:hypothetical protein